MVLFALGTRFNIAGVALAVDTMVVVGITVLLWQARQYVDFSARRAFAVPMLALVLGLAAGAGVVALLTTLPWLSATLKTVLFVLAYGGVLALLERQTPDIMVLPQCVSCCDGAPPGEGMTPGPSLSEPTGYASAGTPGR